MDVRKVKDYASYKLKSSKLTNIHSPFLYDLASKVIYESGEYYSYHHIENIRKKWMSDKQMPVRPLVHRRMNSVLSITIKTVVTQTSGCYVH